MFETLNKETRILRRVVGISFARWIMDRAISDIAQNLSRNGSSLRTVYEKADNFALARQMNPLIVRQLVNVKLAQSVAELTAPIK